jgi:SAM-dependent methyltransferase
VSTASELKDQAWWERYFAANGDWERNGGREQTRIFAQAFVQRAALPADRPFSLLDAGCALGDALAVFAQAWPQAQLHGIDFSAVAIARSRASLPAQVRLSCGDLDAISGHYDAIFCSNTLEHFADFEARATRLLAHCSQLFVMVPFRELKDGRPLQPDPAEHHQHTFERDSFDGLLRDGQAGAISSQVFSCPGAWGWSARDHAVQFAKNLARFARGRHWVRAPRQVMFTITAAASTRVVGNI